MNAVGVEITVDSPQQVDKTDEEEDGDELGKPTDRCEAYKDLHFDKDSDDDDDFNSNNQTFPNVQIVL